MKNKHSKFAIIGVGFIGSESLAKTLAAHNIGVVIAHEKKEFEQKQNPFEPKPIIIHSYRDWDFKEPKFYENEPSKFIGKSKK